MGLAIIGRTRSKKEQIGPFSCRSVIINRVFGGQNCDRRIRGIRLRQRRVGHGDSVANERVLQLLAFPPCRVDHDRADVFVVNVQQVGRDTE